MWECVKCREQVEDQFDLCWACGTSRDGTEDPSFRRADDPTPVPAAPSPPVVQLSASARLARGAVGMLPGIGLALACYFGPEYHPGACVFIGLMGAFIGAALAQPDVSTTNVLAGVMGAIVVYNVPRFMRKYLLGIPFGSRDTSTPCGESGDRIDGGLTMIALGDDFDCPHEGLIAGPLTSPD